MVQGDHKAAQGDTGVTQERVDQNREAKEAKELKGHKAGKKGSVNRPCCPCKPTTGKCKMCMQEGREEMHHMVQGTGVREQRRKGGGGGKE
jgi:hypothetical protein